MNPETAPINPTVRAVALAWLPLAFTWLLMAVELPVISALIARQPDPEAELAAFGVVFHLLLLVESPIFNLTSLANTLARDHDSYLRLRQFMLTVIAIVTGIWGMVLVPANFFFLTQSLLDLPEDVAQRAHSAALWMLPVPFAVGYRRFYQGILIHFKVTRLIAVGTVLRLVFMLLTVTLLIQQSGLPGAASGAIVLVIAVLIEALASRVLVSGSLKKLCAAVEREESRAPLALSSIMSFFVPLALTSLIFMSSRPVLTFFMALASAAVESLAIYPVLIGLIFLLRGGTFAVQEVVIAFYSSSKESQRAIAGFSRKLALVLFALSTLVAVTPLSELYFLKIAGVSEELARLADLPLLILVPVPALSVWVMWQRGILIWHQKTRAITTASLVELMVLIGVLSLLVFKLDAIGVDAVCWGLLISLIGAGLRLHCSLSRIDKGLE